MEAAQNKEVIKVECTEHDRVWKVGTSSEV